MKKKFTNFSINSLYCLIQNCFTGVSQLNISKYCLKENIIVDENRQVKQFALNGIRK